ncbi:MAG: nitroreductase [Lachnospiraceae bacterium]|nr:nitroreductase [Lachnospiraceae bacterium]
MSELDMIKERHSVRNYLDKPIEAEKQEKLKALIDEANEKGNLHLQFIEDSGKVFSRIMNKAMGLSTAPSVIVCIGPDDDTLDERVGYYGEKIVLAAQEMGLNTCWAGTYSGNKVEADIKEGERISIVIAIGYGANQGRPHKSKSFEEVTAGKAEKPDWFVQGVEAALMAPTAINQQKFLITLNDDDTVSITDKGGVLSKVDLGIVKYHFDIASKAARGL